MMMACCLQNTNAAISFCLTTFMLFATTISTNFTCTPTNLCQDVTFNCLGGEDCHVTCLGDYTCFNTTGSTVNCPNNANCYVTVGSGAWGLGRATINGGTNGDLLITIKASAGLKYANIYGPTNGNLIVDAIQGTEALKASDIYCPQYGDCNFSVSDAGGSLDCKRLLHSAEIFSYSTTTLLYINNGGHDGLQDSFIHCPSIPGPQNNCIIITSQTGIKTAAIYAVESFTDVQLICTTEPCAGSHNSAPEMICGPENDQYSCDMIRANNETFTEWICGNPLSPCQGYTLPPTTSNPATQGNPTQNPTLNPTTSTLNPSTATPTTLNPSLYPTTLNPSTAIPTTLNPTLYPTTLNPSTISPTTTNPTLNPITSSISTSSLSTSSPTLYTTTLHPSTSPTTLNSTPYPPTLHPSTFNEHVDNHTANPTSNPTITSTVITNSTHSDIQSSLHDEAVADNLMSSDFLMLIIGFSVLIVGLILCCLICVLIYCVYRSRKERKHEFKNDIINMVKEKNPEKMNTELTTVNVNKLRMVHSLSHHEAQYSEGNSNKNGNKNGNIDGNITRENTMQIQLKREGVMNETRNYGTPNYITPTDYGADV